MAEYMMKDLEEDKKKRIIDTKIGEQQQQLEETTELSPYAADQRWMMPEQQQMTDTVEEMRLQTDSVNEILADTQTTKELTMNASKKEAPPLFEEGEPNLQDIKRKQDSRNASLLVVLSEIMKTYPAFVTHELLEQDKSNPMRAFVTLHDPNGVKVKISVNKEKNEGDKRALWVQVVEKAVKMLTKQYEGGARQDMYAGLSDANKLSSEERQQLARDGGKSEMKAGVMLFMGKRGITMLGLDDENSNFGAGGGQDDAGMENTVQANSAPAPSIPTA